LVQIDAAISSGSSGGAVVNNRGEVIGVAVSSLSSGQNLNFAIPSNYLAQLPLTWQASVNATGAMAISERENEGLLAHVHVVITKEAEIDNSKDTPMEAEPTLKERKEYNELGEEIRNITYFDDNEIRMDMMLEYDERGLKSYGTATFRGKKVGEKKFTDAENLDLKLRNRNYSVTKESEYTNQNNSKVKKSVTYDREGREIEDVRRIEDGTNLKILLKYDSEGRKIEERRFKNGILEYIYQFVYKIDGYGNWIRQTEFYSSPKLPNAKPIPTKVVYREITYF